MDAPDHQKEARILSKPKELEKGFQVVEKKDPSRGRIIFSLAELPIKVVYLTPCGNSLERISHTEVLFRGANNGMQYRCKHHLTTNDDRRSEDPL